MWPVCWGTCCCVWHATCVPGGRAIAIWLHQAPACVRKFALSLRGCKFECLCVSGCRAVAWDVPHWEGVRACKAVVAWFCKGIGSIRCVVVCVHCVCGCVLGRWLFVGSGAMYCVLQTAEFVAFVSAAPLLRCAFVLCVLCVPVHKCVYFRLSRRVLYPHVYINLKCARLPTALLWWVVQRLRPVLRACHSVRVQRCPPESAQALSEHIHWIRPGSGGVGWVQVGPKVQPHLKAGLKQRTLVTPVHTH